jgi:hypothetical protein
MRRMSRPCDGELNTNRWSRPRRKSQERDQSADRGDDTTDRQ